MRRAHLVMSTLAVLLFVAPAPAEAKRACERCEHGDTSPNCCDPQCCAEDEIMTGNPGCGEPECKKDACRDVGEALGDCYAYHDLKGLHFRFSQPSTNGKCNIFVMGVGDDGMTDSCEELRGGAHLTVSPRGWAGSGWDFFSDIRNACSGADDLDDSDLRISPEARQCLLDAAKGNEWFCHSWGTEWCIVNGFGNAFAGGLCPRSDGSCVPCFQRQNDPIPCMLYSCRQWGGFILSLIRGLASGRFAAPNPNDGAVYAPDNAVCGQEPGLPWGKTHASLYRVVTDAASSGWKPHLDSDYYNDWENWQPNDGCGQVPTPPVPPGGDDCNDCDEPKCDQPPCEEEEPEEEEPACTPPAPPGNPHNPGTITDPPFEGEPSEEGSGCVVAGRRHAGGTAAGLAILALLSCSALARRQRLRRAAALLLLAAGGCGGEQGDPLAREQSALTGQTYALGTCKEELEICLQGCQTDPEMSVIVTECQDLCRRFDGCCTPVDVNQFDFDVSCAMAEFFHYLAPLGAGDLPRTCHADGDCDGLDDCSGLPSSICCGDADCNGHDDCTFAAVAAAGCPAPCGDADCDGVDDCSPNLVSVACQAGFAGAVSATCSGADNGALGSLTATDVDVYAVSVPAGSTLEASVAAGDGLQNSLDSLLRITDEAGVPLAFADDIGGSDPWISVTPSAAGTYYVWISAHPDAGFTGADHSAGDYALTVKVGTTEMTLSPRGCGADPGATTASASTLVSAASVPPAADPSACAGTCAVPYQAAPRPAQALVSQGPVILGCGKQDDPTCRIDETEHTAILSDFLIDRTETTQGEYQRCVDAGACAVPETTTALYDPVGQRDRPVVEVTWHQAARYCSWMGKRLPTEAEWEKAARGTDARTYPWGNVPPDCALANFNNCVGASRPVGSYPMGASPYGALDMAGNVAEWVYDWHSPYYGSDGNGDGKPDLEIDPLGPANTHAPYLPWHDSWRVVRGGSWSGAGGTVDNATPLLTRTTARTRMNPRWRSPRLGFRCVSSPIACRPLACEELPGVCGVIDDGCGGTIDCGDPCAAPDTCGGGGTANYCGCRPAEGTMSCGAIWSQRFGSVGDPEWVTDVAVDATGGIGVIANTTTEWLGIVDMGGGVLPGFSGGDGVVAKYTAAGAHVWSRAFGSLGWGSFFPTRAYAGAVAANGDLIVVANYGYNDNYWAGDGIEFGGGPRYGHGFVAVYDAAGVHRWSRGLGTSVPTDVVVDQIDPDTYEIIVTGYVWNAEDFGTGVVTPNAGDLMLLHYADDGTPLSAQLYGGAGWQRAWSLSVAADGALFVTGHDGQATGDFGGGATPSGRIFVAKYTPSGGAYAYAWATKVATGGWNETLNRGVSVAANAAGEVFLKGCFETSAQVGGNLLTAVGARDAFVAKLGASGTPLWATRIQVDDAWIDNGRIALTGAGDLMTAGTFSGTLTIGSTALRSAGDGDAFIAAYAGASGTPLWAQRFGGGGLDQGLAVAVDGPYAIVGGAMSGMVDMGFGPLIAWPEGITRDMLVARLDLGVSGPCVPTTCESERSECGAISDGCGGTLECGDCRAPASCGSGGVANRCGCTPTSCAAQGATCGLIPDGCGGVISCGLVGTDDSCLDNVRCTPTVASCAEAGATCGEIHDGCGRTLACGSCAAPETCGGGGPNSCGTGACTPATCASLGADCGLASDGCGGVLSCGTCSAPESCGGGGTANVCAVCVPQTCAQLGAACGLVGDGCGGTLSCGGCVYPQVCGGGGTPNACGCAAVTCAGAGAECGVTSDLCGGTLDCGACAAPGVCGAGFGIANECCAPATCGGAGAECGLVADDCGHALDCGSACPAGEMCGGGGVGNQCGPLNCVALGAECGDVSDGLGGTIDCGQCALGSECGGDGVPNACSAIVVAGGVTGPPAYGSTGADTGRAMASDPHVGVDAIYWTGRLGAAADLGAGTLPAGVALVKSDSTQSILWSVSMTSSTSVYPTSMTVDGAGDVLVAGYFYGTANLGGSDLVSAASSDIFLAKYAASTGAHMWSLGFGGTGGDGLTTAVAVAPDGSILLAGGFYGTVSFGGSGLTSSSAEDVFVAKLTSSGGHVWSKKFGIGNGADQYATGVGVGADGAVFVTGAFETSINFGSSNATKLTSAGYLDIFFAKLGSDGSHTWSKRYGGSATEQANGLAIGPTGNVAITGEYNEVSLTVEGVTLATETNVYENLFVALFSNAGVLTWAKGGYMTGSHDSGRRVTFSAGGNVVAAGNFGYSPFPSSVTGLDFGGGEIDWMGYADVWVASWDAAGTLLYSAGMGGGSNDYSADVAVDKDGHAWVLGWFDGSATFAGDTITGAGGTDIFLYEPEAVTVGAPICQTLTVGDTETFWYNGGSTTLDAFKFVMPESGTLTSLSTYHNGGAGIMRLAVWGGTDTAPGALLAETGASPIAATSGWQTLELETPVFVPGGTTIWLSYLVRGVNPGIRYASRTASMYRTTANWTSLGGALPATFPAGSIDNYAVSLHARYVTPATVTGTECGIAACNECGPDGAWACASECAGPATCGSELSCCVPRTCESTPLGDTTVFTGVGTGANLYAMPWAMPEDGTIDSISYFHAGGSGSILLGIYGGTAAPTDLLGATAATPVQGDGWQTIPLAAPVSVARGTVVWVTLIGSVACGGCRYGNRTQGSYQATVTWSTLGGALPATYPAGSVGNYPLSLHANYSTARSTPGAECGTIPDGCGGTITCAAHCDPSAWPMACGEGGDGLTNACGCVPGSGLDGCAPPPAFWSRSFGSRGDDDSVTTASGDYNAAQVVVDADGSIVFAGALAEAGDLGNGVLAASNDPVVVKYDAAGNALWSRVFASSVGAPLQGLALAAGGDVIITGFVETSWGNGTIDLDGVKYASGSWDVFVARLRGSNGGVRWARLLGITGAVADVGLAVEVTPSGDVIVGGWENCPGGAGCIPKLLVRRLSGDDGTELWARTSTGEMTASDLAVDAGGDIFIAGYLNGTGDLGTGSLTSAGGKDALLAKLASDGTPLWAARYGGTGDDLASSVAIDPGTGQVVMAGFTGYTALVAAWDPDGTHLWARTNTTCTNCDAEANDVAIDAGGGILVTGRFHRDFTIGSLPTLSNAIPPWSGMTDSFVLKLDRLGAPLWSTRIIGGGANSNDQFTGQGVAVDERPGAHALVVTGPFQGAAMLPGYGGDAASEGGRDIFLTRMADPDFCEPICAAGCGAPDGCGGTCGSACDDGCPAATDCTGLSCGQVNSCGHACGGACDAGCAPDCSAFTCGASGTNACGQTCASTTCDAGCPAVSDCSAYTCGASGANSCGTTCSSSACDAGCCSMVANGCCGTGCNSLNDADCAADTCGDGVCGCTEMAFATCNADCKKTNGPTSGQFVCGNTVCEAAEDPSKCSADCPSAGGCPGSSLQWATSATASSQYSTGGWSAMQATGAPNTSGCGDISTAWAPSTSGAGAEWLRLVYAADAYATGFSIHETNLGGFVDQVEYLEPGGAAHLIWSSADATACGGYLTVTHAQTSYLVREIRVTTSASGWEEIDAVRLIGFSP